MTTATDLNIKMSSLEMEKIRREVKLKLVQLGKWFIIDLKAHQFPRQGLPKTQKVSASGSCYWLAPHTFSRCLDVALQLLCDQVMRVFFYLDDFIMMAGTKEWVLPG